MNYKRSKRTKRFSFSVSRNTTSHKSGANTFTISSTSTDSEGYNTSTGTFSQGDTLTMTVKEAKAMQTFLNSHLERGSVVS